MRLVTGLISALMLVNTDTRAENLALQAMLERKDMTSILVINQHGVANNGTISQAGYANTLSLLQIGIANDAEIEQNGTGNKISVQQLGDENRLQLLQHGTDNQIDITQHGNTSFSIEQIGQGEILSVTQY